MNDKTIEKTTAYNLCCSCGICKAVCPKSCIEYKKVNGQYIPLIDKQKCIQCGLCLNLCPGINMNYKTIYENSGQEYPKDIFIGEYRFCLNAFSKNNDIRKNGTSGGVVTQIVKNVLDKHKYDSAFLVDTFEYNTQVNVKQYFDISLYDKISKSRYISVSHENLIKYIVKNPEKKVIIVAVGCAVYGITKIIQNYKLNRNNYLILGLFCDNCLSYHVYDYFNKDNKLKELYFRTKENSGWPGNVKTISKNGKVNYYPAKKRQEVKKYFQLERCCYCVDKLNQLADISVGDNYTNKNNDIKGSNSLIIRTKIGEEIINDIKNELETNIISIQEICHAQKIDEKKKQADYIKSLYKSKNVSVCDDIINNSCVIDRKNLKNYRKKLKNINIGKQYNKKPYKLYISLYYIKISDKLKVLLKKILNNISRRQ